MGNEPAVIPKESHPADGMIPAILFGGDEGIRTLDLSVANAALSQLSYIPRRIKEVDPAYTKPCFPGQ